MAPRDPRVTDLRRYRRDRERARRAQATPPRHNEPLLGRRRNAGLILVLVVAVLVAMTLLSGGRF
jgi:hypothetical protein